MKSYTVSVLLLAVFAAVGADDDTMKKVTDCVKSINWTKDQFDAACNNAGVSDGPDRTPFLKMNTCLWQASGVLDASGMVHPENAKNIVKSETSDAAVALVTKCTPTDATLSLDAKAEHLYKCYRSENEAKYTTNCLAFGQKIFAA